MLKPRIYGICIIKNENDIIGQTLVYALQYCNKIFVIDNGSTDETWDIVQCLSERYPQIIPFLQTHEQFSNGLRALAYNEYHSQFSDNDWWLIVDGDEFLAEDPQPIIEQAIQERAEIIRAWQIHFYFTDVDHENWLKGRDSREIPIYKRRRHYLINWQENRLFRNQSSRRWDVNVNKLFPDGFRRACRHFILNRHYQFRDPEQIQKRLSLRFQNPLFPHVTTSDWQRVIVPSRQLNYYKEGDPWRFSASGLAQYYRIVLKNTYRAGIRRVQRGVRSIVKLPTR